MNEWNAIGRLTEDPQITYTTGNEPKCVARFTLAVNKRFKREGQPTANFIPCVAFGKTAELFEKYIGKGRQVGVNGELENNNYTDREGNKHYGYQVSVQKMFFIGSRDEGTQNSAQNSQNGAQNAQTQNSAPKPQNDPEDGFMHIPDGFEDDGLPFM